jgi:cytochrome P450
MPPLPTLEGWQRHISGALLPFQEDVLASTRRFAAECGPCFSLLDGVRRVVCVMDPELVHQVLVERHRHYRKSVGYEVLKPMLGQGLLTSEGDFWRKQRRLLQPAFHKRSIAGFARIMEEEGARTAEVMAEAARKGEPVDITAAMNRCTMAIVARCLLGTLIPGSMDRISEHLAWLNHDANRRIMQPIHWPLWLPTLHNRRARRHLEGLLELIRTLIAERRASPERGEDLLSMLVDLEDADTGERMGEQQLLDEVTTVFVAGHETTANAMAWTLQALADRPQADRFLYEELAQLDAAGSTAAFRPDPNGSPRVQAVAKEALRLYPPAWLIGRRPLASETLGPYRLPKDTNVLLFTLGIQRDARWWPDPDRFRPERFLDPSAEQALVGAGSSDRNGAAADAGAASWVDPSLQPDPGLLAPFGGERPKMAYFPFGAGPRICIGLNMAWMEMHILLPILLRKLRFEHSADGTIDPKLDPLITLHPDRPIRLRPVLR